MSHKFYELAAKAEWDADNQVGILLSYIDDKKLTEGLLSYLLYNFSSELKDKVPLQCEEECLDCLDTCPSCQGTGIGDPHMETRCSACRGKGYIEHWDNEEEGPSSWKPM